MNPELFAVRFVVAVLAVWRLTHLFSREAGPFDVFTRLRHAVADKQLGRMIECPFCLSMWIALPATLFLRVPPLESAVSWLALSGCVCLIERSSVPPVVFQPMNEKEEIYS